jgi:hypothetical protein
MWAVIAFFAGYALVSTWFISSVGESESVTPSK